MITLAAVSRVARRVTAAVKLLMPLWLRRTNSRAVYAAIYSVSLFSIDASLSNTRVYSQPKQASEAKQGVLYGSITSDRDKPLLAFGGISTRGVQIELRSGWEKPILLAPSRPLGRGHYESELRTGIYDVLVPASFIAGKTYQPQRIRGVRVRAGRNELNIKASEGHRLSVHGLPRATTKTARSRGWLEGTITDTGGIATWGQPLGQIGVRLKLSGAAGKTIIIPAHTRLDAGGFFEARDVPPGIYTVDIPKSYHYSKAYAPVKLRNVPIAAGEVTFLSITLTNTSRAEDRRIRSSELTATKIVLD